MLKLQKIQKTVSGVIHLAKDYGSEETGPNLGSACGAGENGYPWYEMPEDTEVTCKRCLKKLQKAEDLGLFLKSVRNEDGSYRVIDIRKEDAEDAPKTTHADAVAQMRANIDAEEEARAAARRERNRTNYAPKPEPTEVKPGRCLQRVAEVGKTPTQCVKGHAHEDDHEDRFGQTFPNHAIVPGAEPLSPTAQTLADMNRARDEAVQEMYDAEGTDRQEEADRKYDAVMALRWEAVNAHRKASEAAGDFLPREQREARQALARLNAPKGSSPLAQRLAEDHGLNFF